MGTEKEGEWWRGETPSVVAAADAVPAVHTRVYTCTSDSSKMHFVCFLKNKKLQLIYRHVYIRTRAFEKLSERRYINVQLHRNHAQRPVLHFLLN